MKDINALLLFSLTLDESTDVSNLSQFGVTSRCVVGDTLHEASFAVLSMKGTTRGQDLFESFTEFAKERKIYRWINLFRCALMVLRAWSGKTEDLSLFFVSMKTDAS